MTTAELRRKLRNFPVGLFSRPGRRDEGFVTGTAGGAAPVTFLSPYFLAK
jgi:hypothetical protein